MGHPPEDLSLDVRRVLAGFCFCATLAFSGTAQSQPTGGKFTFDLDREPIASLDGQWRFHPGDDARWSEPDFDDSGWTLIRTGQSWYMQGFPHVDGFAWYRATIQIPNQRDFSLLVPYVITSYQVFANGQLLGGVGAMPPKHHPVGQFRVWAVYRLPPTASSARTVVLAFRVWHSPVWQDLIGGEIDDGLRVGATPLIEQRKAEERIGFLWSNGAVYCLALIAFLAACAALGFWRRQPDEKEYAWFAAAQFLYVIVTVLNVSRRQMVVDVTEFDLCAGLLTAAWGWTSLFFYRSLLGGRRDWLFRAVLGCYGALALFSTIESVSVLIRADWLPFSIVFMNEASSLLSVIPYIWVVGLLLRRAVQGRFDARLLLAPVLLQQLAQVAESLHWVFIFVVGHEPAAYRFFYRLWQWPFPISVANVCDLCFFAGMLSIFVLRFLRTTRQEDTHQREFEAARAVQQVLIPQDTPVLPGISIETVYLPAGVVGGDFFQVLGIEGGALAVVGDVSGKGMAAAMTVSLLVGTFRTLAHYTHSPGEILAAMNQRMLGRNHGGFTTCLALRADPDGVVTVANAGHIPPYLAGTELKVENGLPLGLSGTTVYEESRFHSEPGQQLTLMTDGVMEARAASGELFGFERTAGLSTLSAQEIARAAQSFGQEDDITVLTLKFAAAETPRE